MTEAQFTPRQKAVVIEMCKGKSNKEIARALGMAESTVKLHMTEIFRELGVNNRMRAIIRASDLPITTEERLPPPTDQEVLEVFADTAFATMDEPWSQRVLRFGRALIDRSTVGSPKNKE
jgi:DNA-binding CsgD family transcriptional regulator